MRVNEYMPVYNIILYLFLMIQYGVSPNKPFSKKKNDISPSYIHQTLHILGTLLQKQTNIQASTLTDSVTNNQDTMIKIFGITKDLPWMSHSTKIELNKMCVLYRLTLDQGSTCITYNSDWCCMVKIDKLCSLLPISYQPALP